MQLALSGAFSFLIFQSLFVTLFCVQFLFAQSFVSTTAENKNVVLEEFTGIHCGYCPDGHVMAQNFSNANPGDVVVINLHTERIAPLIMVNYLCKILYSV